MPTGINFNDGAMGGEVMDGNVLFNFVRESNDHGPFNSWDRQPYIYRANEYDVAAMGGSDSTSPYRISPQTQVLLRITSLMVLDHSMHSFGWNQDLLQFQRHLLNSLVFHCSVTTLFRSSVQRLHVCLWCVFFVDFAVALLCHVSAELANSTM